MNPAPFPRPALAVATLSLAVLLASSCGSSPAAPHGNGGGGSGGGTTSSTTSGHGGGGATTTSSSSTSSTSSTSTTSSTTSTSSSGPDGGPPPAGNDWEWLNPTPTGDWLSAVWSDGIGAWAAGERGTAVYNPGGATWSLSSTGTSAALNGIWGSGTTVWAVGSQGTLLGSSDGGATFAAVASSTTADLYGVWGSGTTVFAVGDGGVVLRGDSGSFQALPSIPQTDLRSVWGRSPTDVWAVGSSNTVYHSTDGHTFSSAGTVTTSPINAIRGDAQNLWVVGAGGWGGYAHFDGTTWTNRDINPGVSESLWGVWAASPTDVFMAGDHGELWHTSNDMVSRAGVLTATIPWQLTAIWGQGNQMLLTGGAGTLLSSSDHAATFTSGTVGPHAWQTDDNRAFWGLDDAHLFTAGGNGHVWRSTDGGNTWAPLTTGTTVTLNAIVGRADGTVVASGGMYAGIPVLIRSSDFGDHWTTAPSSPTTTSLVLDGNDLWAAEDSGCNVYHSTDLGNTWTQSSPNGCISADQVWASGSNVVLAGVNQPTYYSTDKAATWHEASMPTGASIASFWGTSPTDLWAAGFLGPVLHSTDGGATWVSGDPAMTAQGSIITGGGGDVFLAGTDTALVTHDGGQTWQALSAPPVLTAIWPSATHLFGVGYAGAILRHKR